MIFKLLLIAGIIAIIYLLFFKKKSYIEQKKEKQTSPEIDDMIECATCGLYVTIDEAILSSGKYYCSQECLQKAN